MAQSGIEMFDVQECSDRMRESQIDCACRAAAIHRRQGSTGLNPACTKAAARPQGQSCRVCCSGHHRNITVGHLCIPRAEPGASRRALGAPRPDATPLADRGSWRRASWNKLTLYAQLCRPLHITVQWPYRRGHPKHGQTCALTKQRDLLKQGLPTRQSRSCFDVASQAGGSQTSVHG